MGKRWGLALTGGGARAAYQAGAIRALSEICPVGSCPFEDISGVSAGAINGTFIAANAHDFRRAAEELCDLWGGLRPKDIYKASTFSLSKIGIQWLAEMSLGGLIAGGRSNYLLDTAPLGKLLKKNVNFEKISTHIAQGLLNGVAVSATNYETGTAVSFYDGQKGIEPWFRSTRIGIQSVLNLNHVMASAAIPIFFPPIRVDGAYFGDGCVRLTAPISPVIHMGAKKIIAIGIRHLRSAQATLEMNRDQTEHYTYLSSADIAGVVLNAVFMDSLETDIERLERINRTVELIPEELRAKHPSKLRSIPFLAIRPSRDLGLLAYDLLDGFPISVRHFLRGMGASRQRGWDLLSYLAFDSSFTRQLLSLGYEDVMKNRAEIAQFLEV